MHEAASPGGDIRQQIRQTIEHLAHLLPGQAPLKDFVHHNTLHGFQHLSFPEALRAARKLTGARGYLPAARYQAFYAEGRIRREDLLAVIDETPDLAPQTLVAELDEGLLRQRDIYLAAMLLPPAPATGCQLNWEIEEKAALRRLDPRLPDETRRRLLAKAQAAGLAGEAETTADLWQACQEVLRLPAQPAHPEELFDLSPELAETLLHELLERSPAESPSSDNMHQLMRQAAHQRLAEQLDGLGRDSTLRELLLGLTGRDLMQSIRMPLIRSLASFLDQGVAGRHPERDALGFYAFWRRQAEVDPAWKLQSIRGWRQHLELLQNDPLDTLISELHRMGLPRERWCGYLERLALELPGWSGMVLWRHHHPRYEGLGANVDMLDYLAVRLVLERIHAHHLCAGQFQVEASLDMLRWYFRHHYEEYTVREALFSDALPEYLASRAQRAINAPHRPQPGEDNRNWSHLAQLIWTWRHSGMTPAGGQAGLCHGAWPLFQMAQRLGLCGGELRQMNGAQIDALFACLERLDEDQIGYLWLQGLRRAALFLLLAIAGGLLLSLAPSPWRCCSSSSRSGPRWAWRASDWVR
jgi:hypothetical protein